MILRAHHKFLISILALLLVFVIGVEGYQLIEDDISFGEAAYMTIITLSTTGFSEIWNMSPEGRIWTACIIVFGIGIVTVAFASLQAMIVGGEMRKVLGRRKLEDKISKLRGHYIVCGYGRMGRLIAQELKSHHKTVVVIDDHDDRTVVAEEDGLPYVLGDATEDEILRDAGLDRAEGLVAALGTDANNVFVTLTASTLRKDMRIIAKAEDFDAEPKLKRAGATHVVCPQAIGAIRMANLISRPAIAQLVDITMAGEDWEIDEVAIEAGSKLAGKNLGDLNLRQRAKASVIAIRKAGGESVVNPGAEAVVEEGDSMVIIGPSGVANTIAELQITDTIETE